MKRNYYIFSDSVIRRKDNTLVFETAGSPVSQGSEKSRSERDTCDMDEEDIIAPAYMNEGNPKTETENEEAAADTGRRYIPVENVEAIYVFGEIRFNTRLLNFLSSSKIPVHVFNYYGYYSGSYYPGEYLNSGALLVRQVRHYDCPEKRIGLASEIIRSAAFNILKNLRYYLNRGADLETEVSAIEYFLKSVDGAKEVPELMGIEGNIRQIYYSSWGKIITGTGFEFEKRIKQPPDNIVNALISFGNMLTYTACLSEIYRTQLSPLISFLHEPGERRFSLSLDIAEIFKPVFVDRIIFKALNQGIISEKHFDRKLNYCYLKEAGKKIFVKEFDGKLKTVIRHRSLKRNVSYRRLVRLECYKLIKHLIGDKQYSGFKIWW